jgi:adenylate kinase
VIVLRCNPLTLKKRLRNRGWSEEKVLENVEAEVVDTILMEALRCKEVYEIDTTNMKSEEVANAIERILKRKGESFSFKPGRIDWIREVGNQIEDLMRK